MRRFQFFIGETHGVVVRCEGGNQYPRGDDDISVWRLEACEVPSAFLACSELRRRGADLPFPVIVPSSLMAALESAHLPTIASNMRSFAQGMHEYVREIGDEATDQFAHDILADEWATQSIVFDTSARNSNEDVSSLFLLSLRTRCAHSSPTMSLLPCIPAWTQWTCHGDCLSVIPASWPVR